MICSSVQHLAAWQEHNCAIQTNQAVSPRAINKNALYRLTAAVPCIKHSRALMVKTPQSRSWPWPCKHQVSFSVGLLIWAVTVSCSFHRHIQGFYPISQTRLRRPNQAQTQLACRSRVAVVDFVRPRRPQRFCTSFAGCRF